MDTAVGPDMRRGIADLNGQGEVVSGIVVMRQGENALGVIERVKHSVGPGKWTTTYQLSPYAVESQVLTVNGSGDYGLAADNSLGW